MNKKKRIKELTKRKKALSKLNIDLICIIDELKKKVHLAMSTNKALAAELEHSSNDIGGL